MADKVRDLSTEEFVEKVLEHDDDLTKQVKTNEIDAAMIIAKHKPSIDKYGISTGIAFAVARLKESILEASSESVKGMLVGQRDRFGTQAPIRMPLLSSNGDHREIISWGTSVKCGDSKQEIPYPCVATLHVVNDGDYKGVPNFRVVSMDSCKELSIPDAVAQLNKVAKSAGEIDGGDELKVVVVKGKIAYIAPATRWEKKEKVGSWGLLLANQRDNPVNHPVMQISLATENGNIVRAIFERQRNAIPTIEVEDFMELCADAVKRQSEPIEQARFLGEILRGREVIIVGFVTKFNAQPEVNYVEVGAYAIFDAVTSKQPTPTQKKVEAPKEVAEEIEPPVEKKPKKVEKKGGATTADSLKEKITQYCDVLGIGVEDLTAEKVRETLAPNKGLAFVESVLDEMKGL